MYEHAPVHPELNKLEVRFVLGPLIQENTSTWPQALTALSRQGISDLQGLRTEVNRRLVPENTMRSLLQTAHREGRLEKLPAQKQNADWPLPCSEEALLLIAERILELEGLKTLLRHQWPLEQDVQKACKELLSFGVGSVSAVRLSPRLLGADESCFVHGSKLDALLEEAHLQCMGGVEEEVARRCEILEFGEEAFLATAPHNAFLIRDGQQMHTLEFSTSMIARMLAKEIGGSSICWTREAQWRTETCYSLGLRHKANGNVSSVGDALDPSNRDPNYLVAAEVTDNAWFQKMKGWADKARGHSAPASAFSLHVDVHGCQDPPKHPAYAMLGLGAMRQHAEALPEACQERNLILERMRVFAEALERNVSTVLTSVLGRTPQKAVVMTGLVAAVNERGEHIMTLSGAWPSEAAQIPHSGRLTQTQQSVSHAGVTHALQLEMGATLRHKLAKDLNSVRQLAQAIHRSWLEARSEESLRFASLQAALK